MLKHWFKKDRTQPAAQQQERPKPTTTPKSIHGTPEGEPPIGLDIPVYHSAFRAQQQQRNSSFVFPGGIRSWWNK
jgi:hypothetical protein